MIKTILIQIMLLVSFIYLIYKNDKIDLKDHKILFISLIYIILSSIFYSSSYIKEHADITTNLIKTFFYYGGFMVISLLLMKNKLKALYISLVFTFMMNVAEYFILYVKLWYIPFDILYVLYPIFSVIICHLLFFQYSITSMIWNFVFNIVWMIIVLNSKYYLFLMMEPIAPVYVLAFFGIWLLGNCLLKNITIHMK